MWIAPIEFRDDRDALGVGSCPEQCDRAPIAEPGGGIDPNQQLVLWKVFGQERAAPLRFEPRWAVWPGREIDFPLGGHHADRHALQLFDLRGVEPNVEHTK